MSDIHVTVKFRNAALIRAIKKSGARSVAQFCEKYNLAQTIVGQLILLKKSPLLKDGEWTKTAWDLSSALHCEPDDIFPTAATRRILVKREYSFEADSENLLTQGEMKTPAVGVVKKIKSAMSRLTEAEKQVLNYRMSTDKTYEEIGLLRCVGRERIRQIEARGIRKLRHPLCGLKKEMIEDVENV